MTAAKTAGSSIMDCSVQVGCAVMTHADRSAERPKQAGLTKNGPFAPRRLTGEERWRDGRRPVIDDAALAWFREVPTRAVAAGSAPVLQAMMGRSGVRQPSPTDAMMQTPADQ
jgi:hypothetical protein